MKKISFLIGSLLGSVAGLLFARESGRDFRARLTRAASPQQKFEVLFQEYLKVGRNALDEIKESELTGEILEGGKEILGELKKRAQKDGSAAVKFAHEKTVELIAEAEKLTGRGAVRADGAVRRAAKKVAVTAKRAAKKAQQTAAEVVAAAPKKPRKTTPKAAAKTAAPKTASRRAAGQKAASAAAAARRGGRRAAGGKK